MPGRNSMTQAPTQILQNPLRTLGIFGNSTLKERAANISKAKAFLRVGKPLTFPSDCAGTLPPVNRTPETLARAESDLTFRENRLRSGQFWFVNKSETDVRALRRVSEGEFVSAANLWKRHTCVASLQNRLVCALIENDWRKVLLVAGKLYSRSDDAPARELAEMFDGSGGAPDLGEFKTQFFDALLEMTDAKTLLSAAPRGFEWRDRLRERAIAPILREIRFEIRVAADVLKSNPEAALRVGEKLSENTKLPMKALREFFSGKHEAPFSDVSDELAVQLSVCAHRAFRNAQRDDAVLRRALKLQKRAQSVAAGTRAKNVCRDNGAAILAEAERLAPAGTHRSSAVCVRAVPAVPTASVSVETETAETETEKSETEDRALPVITGMFYCFAGWLVGLGCIIGDEIHIKGAMRTSCIAFFGGMLAMGLGWIFSECIKNKDAANLSSLVVVAALFAGFYALDCVILFFVMSAIAAGSAFLLFKNR